MGFLSIFSKSNTLLGIGLSSHFLLHEYKKLKSSKKIKFDFIRVVLNYACPKIAYNVLCIGERRGPASSVCSAKIEILRENQA